jgi:integrase
MLFKIVGSDGVSRGASAVSAGSTLRELFDGWYRTEILTARRKASEETVAGYGPLLDRWEELTDNPSVARITTAVVNEFRARLLEAKTQRRLSRKPTTLSPARVQNLLIRLRALLAILGPSRTEQDGRLGFVGLLPWVDCSAPDSVAVPSLLDSLRAPAIDDFRRWMRAGDRWPVAQRAGMRALVALLFYTGYRCGAVLRLRWRHVVELPGQGRWFDTRSLPQSRKKRVFPKPVHPSLWRLLLDAWGGSPCEPDDFLLPRSLRSKKPPDGWPQQRQIVRRWLHRLQGLAGDTDLYTTHDVRAGHIRAVGEQGLASAMRLAQGSVGHASSRTTSGHYWDPTAAAILALPDLSDS